MATGSKGPPLIETVNTTIVVAEGFHLRVDAVGTCVLQARRDGAAA